MRSAITHACRRGLLVASIGIGLAVAHHQPAVSQSVSVSVDPKEWPSHLHDPGGTRFSPLTQITPDNVAGLKVAWVYHMRPPGAAPPEPG